MVGLKHKTIKLKKILAAILFIILYLSVLNVFIEGAVGLVPENKFCLGIELSRKNKIINKFPEGDLGIKYPFLIRYKVADKNQDLIYCLGKNFDNYR